MDYYLLGEDDKGLPSNIKPTPESQPRQITTPVLNQDTVNLELNERAETG